MAEATARRLRVGFSSKDLDGFSAGTLTSHDIEAKTVTLNKREFDALLDQARISAPLADGGPEDTGAVLLVRVENLRVIDRRLIELAPDDQLVRMNDVAQLMREIVL